MKKTILLTPVIAIAIVSMLFSCVDSEKDLYDPSYQTSNPMGMVLLHRMDLIGQQPPM